MPILPPAPMICSCAWRQCPQPGGPDAYLEDAERLLIEKGNVIPMYCSTRSWSLSESFTGVFGDGLGRYFFTGVHKASK